MNDRLLDAYDRYAAERVRAGIIDHSLDAAILDGRTIEEHIVEVLRSAGRLPEGWAREARSAADVGERESFSGHAKVRLISDHSQFSRLISAQPEKTTRMIEAPVLIGGWLRAG